MAEVNTSQGANLVARKKVLPHESQGRVRILASKMPAVHPGAAINDTIFLGRLPIGSRILSDGIVSCAAGTATSTLDIGVRKTRDGAVINASGIAAGVDIAAAGTKAATNGALITNGAEYVTTEEVDVYATVKVAALAANQALKVELQYVTD